MQCRSELTPTTCAYRTRPGSLRPLDLRPQIIRALSSVAVSMARKAILLALRMVSSRDVAVMMWDEPAVSDV
jgi:hypothetical protein